MSRSKRKPIIKDRPRNYKKSTMYWRMVRRRQKIETNKIKTQDEIEITNPKSIVNDFQYSDYKFLTTPTPKGSEILSTRLD